MKRNLIVLSLILTLFPFCVSAAEFQDLENYLSGTPSDNPETESSLVTMILARAKMSSSDAMEQINARLQEEIRRNPQNARAYYFLSMIEKGPASKDYLKKAMEKNGVYRAFWKEETAKNSGGEEAAKDIGDIATAIVSYKTDTGSVPVHDGPVSGIRDVLEPQYISKLPLKDPWGNAYIYFSSSPNGPYWIISYGSNGERDSGLYKANGQPMRVPRSTINDPAQDIIFSDDQFIRSPAGTNWSMKSMPGKTSPDKDADNMLLAAQNYFRASDYSSAAKSYEEHLQKHPDQKMAVAPNLVKSYYNIGVQKLKQGNCSAAKESFNQARSFSNDDPGVKEAIELSVECERNGIDSIRMAVEALRLRR